MAAHKPYAVFLLAFSIAVSLSPGESAGQSPAIGQHPAWAHLWSNDFQAAAESFSGTLVADRENHEARRGLLLAQLAVGDERGLLATLKDYTEGAPHSPYDFLLLDWIDRGTDLGGQNYYDMLYEFAEQLAKGKDFSPIERRWALAQQVALAQILGRKDDIKDCAAKLNRLSPWALLGPFDNTSGCGHRKDHLSDLQFQPELEYAGKFGQKITWFTPQVYPLDSALIPTRYFHHQENVTAYARTQVRLSEAGTYLLSVGFRGDVDVFINDQLAFRCDAQNSGMENQQWLVDLPRGWALITMKISGRADPGQVTCGLSLPDGSAIDDLAVDPTGQGFTPCGPLNLRLQTNGILAGIAARAQEQAASPEVLFWNILRARQEDSPAELEDLCTQATAGHPGCGLIRLAALEALERRGDSKEALVQAMIETAPQLVPAIRLKAEADCDKKRFDLAAKAMDGILAKTKYCFSAAMLKVGALKDNELWEDMRKAADRAAVAFPDEPGPYLELAAYHQNQGALNEAKEFRQMARRRMVPGSRLYFGLQQQWAKEDFGAARGEIEKLRDLQPDIALWWMLSIVSLMNDQNFEGALDLTLTCLRSFPQELALLDYLASFVEKGVVLQGDRYVQLFNTAVVARLQLILATNYSIEQVPEARKTVEQILKSEAAVVLARALDIDPGNFEVRDRINLLQGKHSFREALPDPKVSDIISTRVQGDAYPGQDAVVLLEEKRRLVFDNRASLVDYILAVQILTQDGVQQWENVDLPIAPWSVPVILAKEILKQDGGQTAGERFLNKILFPNLDAGDIILLHYQMEESIGGTLAGNFWDQHMFSFPTAPCLASKYVLLLPSGLSTTIRVWNEAGYMAEGYPKVLEAPGDLTKHVWCFENLPAATLEPMSPPALRYLPWLDLSTIEDWHDISAWYSDIAAGQAEVDADIKEKAQELAAGCQSELQVVDRIFCFVANEINYESVPFFQSGFVPRPAPEVLADGFGDCKDKACLMIALLKAMDYQGYYFALVTPGAPWENPFLPSPRFNHAIVCKRDDGGSLRWYDPTFAKGESNQIPRYLAGTPALIADGQTRELVRIEVTDQSLFPYSVQSQVALNTRGDGSVQRTEELRQVDHMAWLRQSLGTHVDQELKRRQATDLAVEYPGALVTEVSATGLEPGAESLTLATRFEVPSLGEVENGILSMRLPWSSQLSSRYGAVVAQSARQVPIDLWSMNLCENDEVQISLPSPLTLEGTPQGVQYNWQDCRYATSYTRTPEGLSATRVLAISGKIVEEAEYPGFKTWLDEVRRDLNRTHHLRVK